MKGKPYGKYSSKKYENLEEKCLNLPHQICENLIRK